MADVLVLGGGIVGLNTALRLALETRHAVTIWAADFQETTSRYAGAYWWPAPAEIKGKRLAQWALETFESLRCLQADAGVTQRKIVALAEEPWEVPSWFNKIPGLRELRPGEIDSSLKYGVVIESAPVIEPATHLKWLRDKLVRLGVAIEVHSLNTLTDALDKFSIVFNCTGLGARQLCTDTDLHPASGQLVKIRARSMEAVMFIANRPERTAYIIPQPDCTVLGGTYFENDWQTEPDANETLSIIKRCNQLYPSLAACQSDIIACTRALRPVRSSVRLESESSAKGLIIHNYGQGKSGFSLAYGCAGAAVELLKNI